MGTKLNPGKFDCYDAALPDEPMFVLLARDEDAAALVEEWCNRKMRRITLGGTKDTPRRRAKIDEAWTCAREMRLWKRENPST